MALFGGGTLVMDKGNVQSLPDITVAIVAGRAKLALFPNAEA